MDVLKKFVFSLFLVCFLFDGNLFAKNKKREALTIEDLGTLVVVGKVNKEKTKETYESVNATQALNICLQSYFLFDGPQCTLKLKDKKNIKVQSSEFSGYFFIPGVNAPIAGNLSDAFEICEKHRPLSQPNVFCAFLMESIPKSPLLIPNQSDVNIVWENPVALSLTRDGEASGGEPKFTEGAEGVLYGTFSHIVRDVASGRTGTGLSVRRSFDHGITWDAGAEVIRNYNCAANFGEGYHAVSSISTGHPIMLKNNPFDSSRIKRGTFLVAMRNHNIRMVNDQGHNDGCPKSAVIGTDRELYGNYSLEVHVFDPNSQQFYKLSDIVTMSGYAGAWEPFLIETGGELQVYYAKEYGQGAKRFQNIVMKRSLDGGVTWSPESNVTEVGSGRDGMPGVVDLGSGHLVLTFEATDVPKGLQRKDGFIIRVVHSFDGGKTWGQGGRILVSAGTSSYAGAPSIVATPDGRLIVGYQSDSDYTGPRGEGYSGVTHSSFRYSVSKDGGLNWTMAGGSIAGGHDNSGNFHFAIWPMLYMTSWGEIIGGYTGPDNRVYLRVGKY